MHVLDGPEEALQKFLKATNMTREELEQRRKEAESDPKPHPIEGIPEHTQKKMGSYMGYDILDDED